MRRDRGHGSWSSLARRPSFRLRCSAENEEIGIKGLAKRLVTEPSNETPQGSWEPLRSRIGESGGGCEAPLPDGNAFEVFFPKPFNLEYNGEI
jgi:hypothetical protein